MLGQPVDSDGEPLPWYTYSATAFLAPRLADDMKVFEFGSGNSTRWWAGHVGSVTSVEEDPDWYQRVSLDMPSNVELRLVSPQGDAYASAIGTEKLFDIVVIDGADRNKCARASFGGSKGSWGRRVRQFRLDTPVSRRHVAPRKGGLQAFGFLRVRTNKHVFVDDYRVLSTGKQRSRHLKK